MSNPNALLPLARNYIRHDAAAAARCLETLPEEDAVDVFGSLPPTLLAVLFPHLQVGYAAALLEVADPESVKTIVRKMPGARAATVVLRLSEDARERFLPHLPQKLKQQILEHLSYPEQSVGRMMSTDFIAFHQDMPVRLAIQKLRLAAKRQQLASYVYVLNDEERLVGVLNMHALMLAAPDARLESIMNPEVFTVHSFATPEDAADELSKRRYFAAPVVDSERRLLGVIKAEQLIRGVQMDVAEDIQKMVGVAGDERPFSPLSLSLRTRLPWLHVNLATAFLAAGVVAIFEGTIAKMTALAVLLPVVAGQGGNAGAQSLAIVMRGLVMREIPKSRRFILIAKEGFLGTVSGLVTGAVTGVVAWIWFGNPALGVVVALGMLVNLIFAGVSGASIPLLMRRLHLDPAQCSSIILTTVTDVVGFFSFLGFAVLFERYLF